MKLRQAGFAGAVAAALVVALGAATPAVGATAPDVGIWYATWYSKVAPVATDWISGFGGSSTDQFVGDVDGDGKADAVTFAGGTWSVARSTGTAFATPSTWATGHGVGSTDRFLTDVNGDGRADAVAYFNSDVNGDGYAGDWYVALSTGTAFASYNLWKSGHGQNATKRLIADVDGDGKKDALAFFSSSGTWSAALSTGTAFGAVGVWKTGFGAGSANQFAADTDRDGRADAITFDSASGDWNVARSTRTAFGAAASWTTGHGSGSTRQFATDGNGDGYAEPYAFFNADIGLPTADGQPGDLVGREYDRTVRAVTANNILLNSGFGYNATAMFQGLVRGDEYGWQDTVAFYAGVGGGTWRVQRYRAADSVSTNTWAGFPGKPAINYVPYVNGAYQQYDSGDPAVIDDHLETISDAGIDWLLLDETNNLNNVSGAILNRAARVAQRVKAWNDQPAKRDVTYAFAIGGMQFTGTPITVELEAKQVWDEFANNAGYGGSSYYHQVDGKPLLVVYINHANQVAWQSYTGDKSASDHFTVRFASSDPAQAGEYGWQLPATGTVDDSDVMLAMPGWNNNIPGYAPVSRDKGAYYSTKVWDVILARSTKPKSVVINSFNEYAEETAVETADTSALVAPSEKWYNSGNVVQDDLYWNLTKYYVGQYKQ